MNTVTVSIEHAWQPTIGRPTVAEAEAQATVSHYRLRARLAHAVLSEHERGPCVVTLRYRLRARLAHAVHRTAIDITGDGL